MWLSGPVRVGLFFALLAIVLSVVGLARANNLSLRNLALVLVLCGGVWGVVSWAIAVAVVQVEEDVAAEEDLPQPCKPTQGAVARHQDIKEKKEGQDRLGKLD